VQIVNRTRRAGPKEMSYNSRLSRKATHEKVWQTHLLVSFRFRASLLGWEWGERAGGRGERPRVWRSVLLISTLEISLATSEDAPRNCLMIPTMCNILQVFFPEVFRVCSLNQDFSRYPFVQILLCLDTPSSRYPFVQITLCPDTSLSRYPFDQIPLHILLSLKIRSGHFPFRYSTSTLSRYLFKSSYIQIPLDIPLAILFHMPVLIPLCLHTCSDPHVYPDICLPLGIKTYATLSRYLVRSSSVKISPKILETWPDYCPQTYPRDISRQLHKFP